MDKIAVVVIDRTTREFDREYDYCVPESLSKTLYEGMRVIVPFGGGNTFKEGYVVGFKEISEYKCLKSIKKVLDKKPVLTKEQIELAGWMKKRYFCTFSAAIKCMLPAGIGIKSLKVVRLLNHVTGLPSSKQKIVDLLETEDSVLEYSQLREQSCIKSGFTGHLKALEAAGIIKVTEQYSCAVKEKKVRVAELAIDAEGVREDIEKGQIKRIQQIRVLEMLMENEYIAVSDLMRFASVSASVPDTLRKMGYISYRDIEINRDPMKHRDVAGTKPLKPTAEQSHVLERLCESADSRDFSELLLHGVTGSGKTEVYLQLIQHVLDQGRQAIVLVPEISLTPQMVDRFRGRFGERVAVQHSRLSLGERYDQWRLIKDGSVMVVVGARSAVFAPFENIGVIIIDEEHENSYKSETTPKYSAAQIAVQRCKVNGALLLYGSATPSVDTYQRAKNGEMGFLTMKERANALIMPKAEIVDMRRELEEGNRSIFSSILSEEIKKNIDAGQQTMLFLNRRGYASFVLCRGCGIRLKCRHCNITMTYHAKEDRLICHYCGYTVKMPSVCPKCGSSAIRQFGAGTQKVEEELKKHFPGASVIRMDMDTTTGKHSHEEILDKFRNQNINILVGTQMIVKGHDFPNVTLVGALAADSLLGIDDFRASERTFQLLTQVAGRAGRGELPGRVIIQTYNTDDYSIISACSHDYDTFFRQETEIRKRLNYPPFTNIACLFISSPNDRLAYESAKSTYDTIVQSIAHEQENGLLPGPVRAPLARLRNRYRWRIIIKCNSIDKLTDILTIAEAEFRMKKGKSDVELSMDINPSSMM